MVISKTLKIMTKNKFDSPKFNYLQRDMGFTKEEIEPTIYYWWWRALILNEEYRSFCEDKFIGPQLPAMLETRKDFGELKEESFKEWWWSDNYRGARLFGGSYRRELMLYAPSIKTLRPDIVSENTKYMYAVIPMEYCTIRDLKKQFSNMLKLHHQSKRGKRLGRPLGTAKYKSLGRPKISGLKTHIEVYEHYLKHPKKAYWKIAQSTLTLKNPEYKKDEPDLAARNDMSGKVKRHLDKARALIKNAGYGRFPDFKY